MASSLFSRIFGFLLHPLLVLSYMLLLMLALNPFAFGAHQMNDQRSMVLFLYVFATSFLIPIVGISILKPLKLLRSLEMEDKQDRVGPYIISGVFYLWLFKNFHTGVVPELYNAFTLGATIALFFAFFINIFSKLSAHMTGMGAMTAMIFSLAFQWAGQTLSLGPVSLSLNVVLALVLLLSGWMGTWQMSKHTAAEVAQGYAAGFVAVLLAMAIL